MWTRSVKDKVTGLMTVTVWDYDGKIFFEGTFDDLGLAEAAGRDNERLVMQGASVANMMTLDQILLEMSDDEVLAELLS